MKTPAARFATSALAYPHGLSAMHRGMAARGVFRQVVVAG